MGTHFSYYEFFAGAGMARAGLGKAWQCLFANDSDPLKTASYSENWECGVFDQRDVALISTRDLKGYADLAWASFPCQDLSQAGAKMGIGTAGTDDVTRSGAIWPFLKLIRDLAKEGRHPALLALENVVGLLSSNGGADFGSICSTLHEIGYRFGAVVVDASHFVPQSRPRVFIIAQRREVALPTNLHTALPKAPWHTQMVLRARAGLSAHVSEGWVWWSIGEVPGSKNVKLSSIIDLSDKAEWNTPEATKRLIAMMSKLHRERLKAAKATNRAMIGSLYLRMRPSVEGGTVQRAEIAFSDTLGCVRTPKGGASRPRIIAVKGRRVRTRLVSAREAARLMGLDSSFHLPDTYSEAFRVMGDGVVPPVVRFLADRLLEPLATHARPFIKWSINKKETA